VTKDCFDWFLGLKKEGVVGEALGRKEEFDGFDVRHALFDDSGSAFGVAELKVAICHIFQLPFQLNEVCIRR
jgi:hypothetical protein